MDAAAEVCGLRGPAGSALAAFLASGDQLLGGLRPVRGPLPALTVEVRAEPAALATAGAGLGQGPAVAEAVAVRLRRHGHLLSPGPAVAEVDRERLLALMTARGRDAVRVLRADPSLLPELQVGAWWVAGWRARAVRRACLALPVGERALPARLAVDVAFWRGVRAAAPDALWRRLTASSYVVLCYHRLAGEYAPGQERMDLAPGALRRQLRLLRLLGWRPLTPGQVLALHDGPDAVLARRRYVVTADDGFTDAVDVLTGHSRHHPQVFAVTGSVGGRAGWMGDLPLADADALLRLRAAGALVGSHARHHVPLDELEPAALRDELVGSLADLRALLPDGPDGPDGPPEALLAYPHGRHDAAVRAAARDAGYRLAYGTQQGRNGPGTDRWCLRRVEPKGWDSAASFLWKVLTGESPPPRWERRLRRQWQARRARGSAGG